MENYHSTVEIVPNAPDKPPDGALPPGSLLNHDKYLVGRVLGRGGFGITYLALDQNLRLRVAVKECLPRHAAWRDGCAAPVRWGLSAPEQKAALENFVKEARKMAKIDQIPGVVRVREYFYDNDTAYIVMDYVNGETLAERLSRTGPMDAAECFRLLSPVMDSLALAHGRGLVHRDVSPNNIMIERDSGKVWLLDLGAAKDMGARLSAPNVSNGTQIVGTPGYTPLEQYDPDGKIGPWTDIYAMSSLFFRCMTGKNLPPSTSRAMKDEIPELLRPMPGKVGAVLLKGLAQNPKERYQTMTEFRDALEKAIPKRKGKKPKTKKPSGKSAIFKAAFFMLALCAAAGALFLRLGITASGKCGGDASWTLYANGLLTISGTGSMDDYDIVNPSPDIDYSYFYNYSDTPWRQYKDMISSVWILKGITRIGENAFKWYDNLESVKLPDTITTIGEYAFGGCENLTSINIPNGVTAIGQYAFYSCASLASVTIPDSVREISGGVFSGCDSLTGVNIPNGVTSIGKAAFWDCSSLASVTIPDSVIEIGQFAFHCCGSLASVTIPDSVGEISEGVFSGCDSLTGVDIPNGVTAIGAEAFFGCSNLTSVTIPESVRKIGNYAFYNCGSLASVTIPGSVSEIEGHAFECCVRLANAHISEGVESIGYRAFAVCIALESIEIPYSMRTIDDSAFEECTGLTSVTLPYGIKSVFMTAFDACPNLTLVMTPA